MCEFKEVVCSYDRVVGIEQKNDCSYARVDEAKRGYGGYGRLLRPGAEIEATGNRRLREAMGGYGRLLRLGAEIEATGNLRPWEVMGGYSALEPKAKPLET